MALTHSNHQYKVVFAGGGTAGHVMPGLAVADALLEIGYLKEEILFMGSSKGMEKNIVEKAGFEISLYNTKGLLREVSLHNLINVLKSCANNAKSFVSAYLHLKKHRPRVLVMLGGYAGLVPALAGLCLKIPTIVINLDVVPGLSNRIIGRFAKINTLPAPNPTVARSMVTGTPLRRDIGGLSNFLLLDKEVDRVSLMNEIIGTESNFKLSDEIDAGNHDQDKPRLLILSVISGSLGAYSINKNIPDLALNLAMDPDIKKSGSHVLIYHVTGERDFDKIRLHCLRSHEHRSCNETSPGRKFSFALLEEKDKKIIFEIREEGELLAKEKSYVDVKYCVAGYEDKVPQLLCVTDLFLGRAGASTVAELSALGVASILVPLPNAPRDHQRENIKLFLNEQAVLSIEDENLNGENLYRMVSSALLDQNMRQKMAASINQFGKKEAATVIAELVRSIDVA